MLTAPHFQDPDKAREYLERIRWKNGRVCPHCGAVDKHYKLEGKAHRPGLYKCSSCREQFTVTVGTVFERSKVPLNKWLMAVYLVCSSKKGISSHQLHRTLGVTYKTAWFMSHRIREAMTALSFNKPLGEGGGTVEADETFWGNNNKVKGRGYAHKEKIFSLVERGGKVRSFHVPAKTLKPILKQQVAPEARIMTDEMGSYRGLEADFAGHETVTHSTGEYVQGHAHTNTVEGYFSILKRGLIGTFRHVGAQHLRRYVSEFDFRYNHRKVDDVQRVNSALEGIAGKRLMYRDSSGVEA